MQFTMKKMSSPKGIDVPLVRKIRRLYHIKSLPAYGHDFVRKQSHSKLEAHQKDEPEVKIKKFKTHQHLKHPHFGTVRTARDKNSEWTRKKEQSSNPSKSLTKSTTYRSPHPDKQSQKKSSKLQKQKTKKNGKKIYPGILQRVRQVVQQYQLKLDRCLIQKEQIVRENVKLKNQVDTFHRKSKKHEK